MITVDALRQAARRVLAPGISREQAIVIAWSELAGDPLSPWLLDDAAIILRAERLLIEGIKVDAAVATARAELIAWVEPEEAA